MTEKITEIPEKMKKRRVLPECPALAGPETAWKRKLFHTVHLKVNTPIFPSHRVFPSSLTIRFWVFLFLCIMLLYSAKGMTAQKIEKSGSELGGEAFEHFVNGDLYELSGDFQSALLEYQKAVAIQPDVPEIRYALARAYLIIKDVESAKREALQIEPKDADTYRLLGDCYRAGQQGDSAAQAYSMALELDSTDLNSLWYLAVYWEQKNDINKAIDYWKKLGALQSFSPAVHLQLATLLFQIGEYDEAVSEYKKVLDLQPDNRKALYGLGQSYEANNDLQEAIDAYKRFLELEPTNEQVRNRIIVLYYQTGEKDEAIKEAETYAILSPDDPDAWKRLGALYLSQGDYQKAESLFVLYIQSKPDDAQIHFYLGRIALEKENLEKAKKEFETAVALEDSVPDGWINLALVYLKQDSTQKAIQVYDRAMEKVADKTLISYLLGTVYAQEKNYDSAIVILKRASDKSPEDTRILFALGSAYEQSGDFDRAVAMLERLLRIDSTNASALNYLGYMFADKGIRLDESLSMIKKALESEPNNGAYLDSYGWVLYRQGQLKEAEIQIKKALEVIGNDPIVHEHLGDIYNAQGESKKAKKEWEEALKLNPDNANLKKKLKE
jgi:tetratricopeptide (TPR) repeat protein